MSADESRKHSPLPWVMAYIPYSGEYVVYDAEHNRVARMESLSQSGAAETNYENAILISQAVNSYDRNEEYIRVIECSNEILTGLLARSLDFVAERVAECEEEFKGWAGRETCGHAMDLKRDIDEGNAILKEARAAIGEEAYK